ncbi:insulin receptor-like [Eriocheir sinensis]|uniref:insulin receptor-like n=1 Tax=Eriocheir sinensis TaxID=95602 RepID=UPI0021C77207|nr:insulin receptor-like [Eriocheir sinensis]
MFVDGINWNYKDGLDLSKFCREEFIIGCDKLTILDEQPLGYGHFGIVRRGDLRTEGGVRRVAVKTHSRDDDSNKEISRFLKEAEILQDIRCHHVVQLVGVVSDSDSLYVVMELMEERTSRIT